MNNIVLIQGGKAENCEQYHSNPGTKTAAVREQ